MFTCFNVGAISGAHAAKRHATPMRLGEFERYKPEPRFRVAGMISVRSGVGIRVNPSLDVDGVELRFEDTHALNKLIEQLTRLRDDMVSKESGEVRLVRE